MAKPKATTTSVKPTTTTAPERSEEPKITVSSDDGGSGGWGWGVVAARGVALLGGAGAGTMSRRVNRSGLRRPTLVGIVLGAALLVAACGDGGVTLGQNKESTPGLGDDVAAAIEPELPLQVVSDNGESVTVDSLDRIVSLDGGVTEILFALGMGDRLVGRDISTTFAEAEKIPLLTKAHDISAESVLSVRPDLVIASELIGPPEAKASIEAAGVPVVTMNPVVAVDGVGDRIRAVGELAGVAPAAEELAAGLDEELDEVAAAPAGAEAPLVAFLYVRGSAGVYLMAGPGSGVDSLIEASGATDASAKIGLSDPFTPLTSEALVKAQPDVILVTTTGLESVDGVAGLMQIPGVAQTPAGRSGRVVTMEDGLLFSFGVRTPEVVESLKAAFAESGQPDRS